MSDVQLNNYKPIVDDILASLATAEAQITHARKAILEKKMGESGDSLSEAADIISEVAKICARIHSPIQELPPSSVRVLELLCKHASFESPVSAATLYSHAKQSNVEVRKSGSSPHISISQIIVKLKDSGLTGFFRNPESPGEALYYPTGLAKELFESGALTAEA